MNRLEKLKIEKSLLTLNPKEALEIKGGGGNPPPWKKKR